MMKIAAVIPVYNEEDIIVELCTRTAAALAVVSKDYQLVIVDDGSADRTWERLQEQSKNNPNICGIRLSRNFGQHPAITAGLDHTDADWVVVMDGDLQDRPEIIPELYKKAQEGYDVVFVERQERPVDIFYKCAQKSFYKIFQYLAKTDYNPAYGNFSIISRDVVKATKGFRENIRFYGGMIYWIGFKRSSITQKHDERFGGTTSYSLKRRFQLAFDIIIAHSERPLHMAIILGMLFIMGSMTYGTYTLITALFFDYAVQGWASLIVSLYFIGGIIMALLGVIGLYIGKIFTQIKERPLYVTSEKTNITNKDVLPPV